VDDDVLKSERTGHVLCLTLNRPQARNALDLPLTRALMAGLNTFDADDALHVLVITGTDPAFCAGLDLKAFSSPDSPRSEVGSLLHELPRRRKPVIGATARPSQWMAATRSLFAEGRATLDSAHSAIDRNCLSRHERSTR
jgi:enoyl-CoA hydratase/carnithine racemase